MSWPTKPYGKAIHHYPRWQIDAGQWVSYLPLLAVTVSLSILWLKRGNALFKKRQLHEAIANIKKPRKSILTVLQSATTLAWLSFKTDNWTRAITQFQEAFRLQSILAVQNSIWLTRDRDP